MGLFRRYLSKSKLPFAVAVSCVAFEAFCDLLGPTLIARVINFGIEENSLHGVIFWGGFMLLTTFCGACFAVTRNNLASRVSQRIGAELRFDLFSKIMNLSERDIDKIESGSLITRVTNDTAQVTQAIGGIMRVLLKAPITCVGSIILATALNFRLSVIIYGVVALVGTMIAVSMKFSYIRFAWLQRATDRMNTVVQEYLIGIRLIKAFGTYEEEEARFGEANEALQKRGVASQIIIILASPVMTLVVGAGSVLAIYMGAGLFELELIKPGDISAFIIYMAQILSSLLMITNIFNVFVRTRASTERINEVLVCEDDFQPTGGFDELEGSLCFENVTFAYPTENRGVDDGPGGARDDVTDGSDSYIPIPAIKNLSFSVSAGESLAIIGPTGSGKSTVCWLSLRFYDVDEGRILVGGRDVKELSVDSVRSNVAVVPQKPMLFSGSVADNIRWGRADASTEDVREAAAMAQAGFIDDLPRGFDGILGSGGVNLSGGQKQRVSIARGLVRDAPILILDDATSALDAETEARVRQTLMGLDSQTIVIITQRCTTAMFADKILVLENGVAEGFGTHAELMESCGIYQEIYRSQVDTGWKEARR